MLWQKKNPQKANARTLRWAKKNPAKVNARTAKRYADKVQATPKWANPKAIEAMYDAAKLLTRLTGYEWQVDHIVPLRHPLVQGLHVEFNLQVIPAKQNQSKGNRYWPGMP